jgi:hypothetical protein
MTPVCLDYNSAVMASPTSYITGIDASPAVSTTFNKNNAWESFPDDESEDRTETSYYADATNKDFHYKVFINPLVNFVITSYSLDALVFDDYVIVSLWKNGVMLKVNTILHKAIQ